MCVRIDYGISKQALREEIIECEFAILNEPYAVCGRPLSLAEPQKNSFAED